MRGTGPRQAAKTDATAGVFAQAGRVKVCVRCRPPFREEVDTSQDVRKQLVVTIPPHAPCPQLVRLQLDSKVRGCQAAQPAARV